MSDPSVNKNPESTAPTSTAEPRAITTGTDMTEVVPVEATGPVTLKEMDDRLDKVTDRMSAQVRTLGLGLIAFTWGLLVGDSAVAKRFCELYRGEILIIGGSAILSLMLDFIQYISGYQNAFAARNKAHDSVDGTGDYDSTTLSYKVQINSFRLKQAVLLAATLWLLFRIATFILHPAPTSSTGAGNEWMF
jgi:hypothetical protein